MLVSALTRPARAPSRIAEARGSTLPTTAGGWRSFWGGATTWAGPKVSVESSLTLTTFYRAVDLKSSVAASLPLQLYHRQADGGRQLAIDESLYWVLHDLANEVPGRPGCTSYQALKFLFASLYTHGNAIAWVERAVSGDVIAYYPLSWRQIDIQTLTTSEGRQIVYRWSPEGGLPDTDPRVRFFRPDEVWHFMGLSLDGWQGISPVVVGAQAIGHGLAAQEYGARVFGQGAHIGGQIIHPAQLKKEGRERVAAEWAEQHQGTANAHRAAVLSEGMEWKATQLTPEAAQYLETRKYNRTEMATLVGLPPHLVGDLERATFSNIEQQNLEFVVFSLSPDLVNAEKAITRDMLRGEQRRSMFARFSVQALLRGDSAARSAFYASGIQNSWLKPNEARSFEDLNPEPGGGELLRPLNLAPIEEDPDAARSAQGAQARAVIRGTTRARVLPSGAERRAEDRADDRVALAESFVPVFEDAVNRVVRAETREINKIMRAQFDDLTGQGDATIASMHVQRLYGIEGSLRGMIESAFRAPTISMAVAMARLAAGEIDLDAQDQDPADPPFVDFVQGVLEATTATYAIASSMRLNGDIATVNPVKSVSETLGLWALNRAAKVATRETREQAGVVTREVWDRGGVASVWQTRGDSCPWCESLDGRIVGRGQPFVIEGSKMDGNAERPPLQVASNRFAPPLHKGCDCSIVPG